jgi:excisionase family DNA binding protein
MGISRSKPGQSASETLEGRGSSKARGISSPQGPRLLSIKRACEYSGFTDWTVRNLVWTGKLPYLRVRKKIWIERSDLDRFIDTNKEIFGA